MHKKCALVLLAIVFVNDVICGLSERDSSLESPSKDVRKKATDSLLPGHIKEGDKNASKVSKPGGGEAKDTGKEKKARTFFGHSSLDFIDKLNPKRGVLYDAYGSSSGGSYSGSSCCGSRYSGSSYSSRPESSFGGGYGGPSGADRYSSRPGGRPGDRYSSQYPSYPLGLTGGSSYEGSRYRPYGSGYSGSGSYGGSYNGEGNSNRPGSGPSYGSGGPSGGYPGDSNGPGGSGFSIGGAGGFGGGNGYGGPQGGGYNNGASSGPGEGRPGYGGGGFSGLGGGGPSGFGRPSGSGSGGYGQDGFDGSSFDGIPFSDGGISHSSGGNIQTQKAIALKALAGVALIGAAAALASNPVLLPLGVVSGRRKKRSVDDDFEKDDPLMKLKEYISKISKENVKKEDIVVLTRFLASRKCVARLSCEIQREYASDVKKYQSFSDRDKSIYHSLEHRFMDLVNSNILSNDHVNSDLKKHIKNAITIGSKGGDCNVFVCDLLKG